MPELPEVEVVRLRLLAAIVHREIAEVRTARQNYAFLTAPARLRTKLLGRRIDDIERQGKYLLFCLDDRSHLVVHLGMTGQLFTSRAVSPRLHNRQSRVSGRDPKPFEPDQHTHMSLAFADGGEQLHFRDSRKFGKLLWLAPGATDARLQRLGVDALALTPDVLQRGCANRKMAIKTVLLDQSVLAGVGNIYADEALFKAGIAPRRSAQSLLPGEVRKLTQALRTVLRRAIALGGSTIDDYVHPDGSEGQYQNTFSIYGREGEPCGRCRTPIVRIVLGQRSAHFCPKCQR
jgi:formamidopyrimidine-DNA glycosylase